MSNEWRLKIVFNIIEFSSQIAERGVLAANKFQCTFNLPPCFTATDADYFHYINMVRDMGLWIDGASIPSVILNNVPLRRYGYGATEKRPIVPSFSDVPLRVIADGAGMTWELFRRWVQKVVNYDNQAGMSRTDGQVTSENAGGIPMQSYESSYPGDYTTQIAISMYNQVGGEQKRIILTEAYPSGVSDIQLAWDNNNQIARFTVNMTIQDWYVSLT